MYLAVKGYKSIYEKRALQFDGLTILAGANSSGKSSFMQPFLILKQTLENHYDAKVLSLEGENVKFTDSSQLISKVPSYRDTSFSLYYGDFDESVEMTYTYSGGSGFRIERVRAENPKEYPKGLEITKGMRDEDIEEQIPNSELLQFKKYFEDKKQALKWVVERKKCFLNIRLRSSSTGSGFSAGIDPSTDFERLITRLIHVPGLRGNPERTYRDAFAENVFPGSFEKYVAGIISHWGESKIPRFVNKLEALKRSLVRLGLASDIGASKINDTRLELRVSRFKSCNMYEDNVNIADVGFGVSQTLPVLVALLVASKGQMVFIEQPELHLHPKAQYAMSEIIADAVSRGVLVVIETHSSILIRGLQTAVVQGDIEPGAVSLNWFEQNRDNGQAEVSAAFFDELGAFGDWPEDFDDISMKADEKYLDAVEKVLHEKNK